MASAMAHHGAANQNGQADDTQTGEVLGMKLETLTDDLSKQLNLNLDPGATGAVVTDVAADSVAARMGVQPGAVITRVGDTDVTTAHEAYEALKQVDPAKGVRLSLLTPEGNTFLFLREDQPSQ